jgi:hypothetical protein
MAPETQASLSDIKIRSEKGCTGCRLLRDILNRFPVQNDSYVWISLVAPTSYTSLYRLQSNAFGPLEMFVLDGARVLCHDKSRD